MDACIFSSQKWGIQVCNLKAIYMLGTLSWYSDTYTQPPFEIPPGGPKGPQLTTSENKKDSGSLVMDYYVILYMHRKKM